MNAMEISDESPAPLLGSTRFNFSTSFLVLVL